MISGEIMNARLPVASSVPARLALLRGAMVREDLAAYLVPSADPHLSEYLPERWQARRWPPVIFISCTPLPASSAAACTQ